jgi:hypothetical protein
MILKELSFGNHLKIDFPKKVSTPRFIKSSKILVEQPLHPDNIASMADHAKTFYTRHRDVISDYKDGSEFVNSILRDTKQKNFYKDTNTPHYINNLKYVTSHQLVQPQILYRGNMMEDVLPYRSKFSDKGFVSTSYDTKTPKDFSEDGDLFAIHAPIGTKAYHIDKHGEDNPGWNHQEEVLLHPATHFKVIGHSKHPSNFGWDRITHLVVIGQGFKNEKPDTSLIKTPENRAWLADTIKNHVARVTS